MIHYSPGQFDISKGESPYTTKSASCKKDYLSKQYHLKVTECFHFFPSMWDHDLQWQNRMKANYSVELFMRFFQNLRLSNTKNITLQRVKRNKTLAEIIKNNWWNTLLKVSVLLRDLKISRQSKNKSDPQFGWCN